MAGSAASHVLRASGVQRVGTATSPMRLAPATPEKTTLLIPGFVPHLKVSKAALAVLSALAGPMPVSARTTSLPASLPTQNWRPSTSTVRLRSTRAAARRGPISAGNAERTSTRDTHLGLAAALAVAV